MGSMKSPWLPEEGTMASLESGKPSLGITTAPLYWILMATTSKPVLADQRLSNR